MQDLPSIVSQFVRRVLTSDNLDLWQRSLNDSRSLFLEAQDDGVSAESKECSHRQFLIHRDFTDMVEACTDQVCTSIGTTPIALYAIMRDHMNDKVVDAFMIIVGMTTQFEIFAEMMRDKEKQRYLFGVLGSWQSLLTQEQQDTQQRTWK
jgi:hypothetical protein